VAQEGEDFLRGKGLYLPVTELGRKLGEKVEVIPERVFFRIHPVVIQKRLGGLGYFHGGPPFSKNL
jgi:hypothetical protein